MFADAGFEPEEVEQTQNLYRNAYRNKQGSQMARRFGFYSVQELVTAKSGNKKQQSPKPELAETLLFGK